MSLLKKHSVSIPDTAEKDPRLGHLLGRALVESSPPEVVLIGFPSDKGVQINGGRVGASDAPAAIRRQLYKMTPMAEDSDSFVELIAHCEDVGDIDVQGELERDQQKLGEVVAEYLEQQIVPVIIGGGHETAFGHFLGYAKAGIHTSIFNLDAHTDVRPLKNGRAHSGSPFRQALEHEGGHADSYFVGGVQPHSAARSHLEFIEEHGGAYLYRDEVKIASIENYFDRHAGDRLMVTFDMDAVDQSQAPGVSAPCAHGLPADLWLNAAYLAGRNEEVTSFDLSEVNPAYDRDEQTVRLAALTLWHFFLGLSQRI